MEDAEDVEVTREHRLLAYRVDRCCDPPPGSPAERWVETGNLDHPLWKRIAQAIAEAEASRAPKPDPQLVADLALVRQQLPRRVDWVAATVHEALDRIERHLRGER